MNFWGIVACVLFALVAFNLGVARGKISLIEELALLGRQQDEIEPLCLACGARESEEHEADCPFVARP